MSENKENVPKIRFPGFTDAWEQCKLKDICSISTGKSNTQDRIDGGEYPFYVRSAIIERSNRYLYDEEAVLTVGDGVGTGKVFHYINGKYDLHQRVYRMFDFTDEVIGKYFYHSFSNDFYDRVMSMTAKTSVDSVRYDMIAEMKILLPNLDEQKKITAVFDTLDHLITLHQRKLNNVKNLKVGLLQKMFPKDSEVFPEVRFPGFTDAWEQRELGQLANFTKGTGYTKSDLREAGTPIILYGRLYTDYETCIEDVNTFVDVKENSVISIGGEVVVPSSGESAEGIARASVVGKPGIVLGGDLNIIKPIERIDPVFLALAISNGTPNKDMAKRAQGKSVVHLHNSDLKNINLIFPHIKEQRKIVEFNLQLDHLITLHQRKLEHLQEQKKALLQQMFV